MISPRLKLISSFISKDDKVIDVGCDHGLLSIYLAKDIGCKSVLATDVNYNALTNAINNINKYQCNNRVDTMLTDGLREINTSKYNAIVISGMGANTIMHILSTNKLDSIDKIVIQSNNNIDFIRNNVLKIGYKIAEEKTVLDNKKYYCVIKFVKGKAKYSKKELKYGPILISNKENVDYFKYLYNKQDKIYKSLPKNKIFLKLRLKHELYILKKIINNT